MEQYTVEKNNDILEFAGKWTDLENIILSEVPQTQKEASFFTSLFFSPAAQICSCLEPLTSGSVFYMSVFSYFAWFTVFSSSTSSNRNNIPKVLPSERTCLQALLRNQEGLQQYAQTTLCFVNFERYFCHNPPWWLSLLALSCFSWVGWPLKALCLTFLTHKMRKKNLIYFSALLWEVCSREVVLYLVGLLKTVSNLTHTKTRKAGNISPFPSGIDIIKA